MRFIPVTALCLAFSSLTARAAPVVATQSDERDVVVYDYGQFEIPCPGCFNHNELEAGVEKLYFDLSVQLAPDFGTVVVLNGQSLGQVFDKQSLHTARVSIPTLFHGIQEFQLNWQSEFRHQRTFAGEENVEVDVRFEVTEEAASTAFNVVVTRASSSDSELRVLHSSMDIRDPNAAWLASLPSYRSDVEDSDEVDLSGELETLHLLESQARYLNAQIATKKKVISYTLRKEQDQLCLKHLVAECDGVLCATKAVLLRLCHKVGLRSEQSLGGVHIHKQQLMALLPEEKHLLDDYTDGNMPSAESVNMPLILTKNGTQAFTGFDLINPPNPIVRALQIVAAVLGITAVLAFIRRRCMSMRKRVERRADIEERRNARAYKRAARRALMRKRWDSFVGSINCFKAAPEHRMEDYEEKRALILQDAFLEQELDQAEKGEVMEAEIRELRYAHEIVSSLVQVGEHRFDLMTPINDPPPPLVPLPYTPADSRSRANSSYTLPSYTSETLPDYSSRPDESTSTSSMIDGLSPSTSESEGRQSPISPISEYSQHTGATLTSSVLDMSPRPSQETMRTRLSRSTGR